MKSPWRSFRLLAATVITILFMITLAFWRHPELEHHSDVNHSASLKHNPTPKQTHHESQNTEHLINQLKLQDLGSFDFSSCGMSNCFDYSLCKLPGQMRVGIVPSKSAVAKTSNTTYGESNLIHEQILNIVRKSAYYEPDLAKACLFILEEDTLDRDSLSQSFRPELTEIFGSYNNYGMNHLVFNLYSGTWPDYKEDDFAGIQTGAAILAKASNSMAHHRREFDISLPLFSYLHPDSDSDLNEMLDMPEARDRNLFLTFKGKRYVFGSGSETRKSVYHIDNHRDIIMLTTCRHGKKWREASDARCAEDDSRYDEFDYVELMRGSKFCLVPRGRRLGSFRYLEALSFGCIPVILSDGWVKPFDEVVDWSRAALQFNESQLLIVGDSLRDFTEAEVDAMRLNGLSIYRQYFSTKERIVLSTLSIIESRIKSAFEPG